MIDAGFQVAEGDPAQIAQAAEWHQELADAFELHEASIRGAASSVLATWNGEAARSYGQLSTVIGEHFAYAAERSRYGAELLRRYSSELDRLQRAGTKALQETEHWLQEQNKWQGKLQQANKAIAAAQADINAAQAALSDPGVFGAPSAFLSTAHAEAVAALARGRAALKTAQDQQRTAQRNLEHAEQQAMLWQGRGRQAWEDAMAAASQAIGGIDDISITPPPLAGWAVPDRFNTPPPPPPVKHHHGGGFLHFVKGVVTGGASDLAGGASWAFNHGPGLALRAESTLVSYSLPGLVLRGVSAVSGKTVGFCLGGGASGPDGLTAAGSVCYDATPSGQSGITVTGGGGVGTPDSVDGSVGPVISNGTTLSDQGGPFGYGSAGAGEGLVAGGATASVGRNSHGKTIWDFDPNWTPSLGDPYSLHAGATNTWTFRSFGP